MKIPFNKPYIPRQGFRYISESIKTGHISGNGTFTKKCQSYFCEHYGFYRTLLTQSCTDALEMAAILLNIVPGDEVIMPSYTFVSTANAFVLRGAKIIFVDSESTYPNLDVTKIEERITEKTKAVVAVHYGGAACEMDTITKLSEQYRLHVVEDAAQAIHSFYKGKALGSIGHLGAFSFHETKNIQSGEGGLLIINDKQFANRAEIIWEKGTNRAAFSRGEIEKYHWVDIGSSYLPSDLVAAFLYAQLEKTEAITRHRIELWNKYHSRLKILEDKGYIKLPQLPSYATNNGHLFFILVESTEVRKKLTRHLYKNDISAVFHYLSLHKSPYYSNTYSGPELPHSDYYSDHLLRLPMYYELNPQDQDLVIKTIIDYYR